MMMMRFRRSRALAHIVRLGTLTTGLFIILATVATGSSALRGASWTPESAPANVQATQSSTPRTPLIILPSNQACVAGGKLTIRFNSTPHGPWAKVTIYLNGKRLKTLKRPHITRLVTITGLPQGSFLIAVTGVARAGRARAVNRRYRACAPKSSRTMSVGLAGTGSGRVTGSGISCPGICSDSYPAGTMVTLTGAAESGSSFAGWSGGGCSGTGTCVVTMSSTESVTATFATNPPPSYTLTVALAGTGSGSVTGSGISCPGICSDSYPAGTMVTLTGAAESGSSFAGWSGGGCSGTGTCTVTMSSGQSVTATFATNGTGSTVGPGRYTAGDPQSRSFQEMSFYVAPSGSLQDVIVTSTDLECAPGEPIGDMFYLPEVPVNASGTFSQEIHKEQILKGVMAKYTYVLTGSETGSEISGSFREDIVYNDGLEHKCSTNNVPWTGTQEGGQSTLALPAAEGSYNGGDPQSRSFQEMTFYVSPVGNLQDVVVTATFLHCTPSAEVGDRLELPEVTVGADGSFSAEKEVEGVFENTPAKFAYALSGHVHGAAANGEPRVTGIFREQITYNNGTTRTCSTDDVYFKAARDEKQGAKSLPAQEGRYTAGDPQGRSFQEMSFYVSAAGNLQDVVVTASDLECSPGEPIGDTFYIGEAHVNGDGSFTAEGHQDGVVKGVPAQYTYVLSGHVHGTGPNGEQRVDGIFREEIAYNDGTSHTCSTNNHYWMASREEKQGAISLPAQEGFYGAGDPQGRSFQEMTFSVTPLGDLSHVVVTSTLLRCDPSAEVGDKFEIPEVEVEPDGSFDAEREVEGIFEKTSAKFVYTISGHVHGAGSNGEPRLSGIFREDITYDNGTERRCSTDDVYWAGART
jgi:List-Bact-rpt repeat protein